MSLKATTWALNDVHCEPVYKAILFAIGDNADDDGFGFPSIPTIRRKSGCGSEKTVQRRIQDLELFGVIIVSRRRAGRHKTQNFYRLRVDVIFDLSERRHYCEIQWGQNVPINQIGLEELNSAIRDKMSLSIRVDRDKAVSPSIGTKLCPPNRNKTIDSKNTDKNKLSIANDDPGRAIEISISWRPSANCLSLLESAEGIGPDDALEDLPTFVLYWMARRDNRKPQSQFDALFYKHAKINYRRRQSEPAPIPGNWAPTSESVSLLIAEGVPAKYINSLAKQFLIYWRDRGSARVAWSSIFVSYCLDQYQSEISAEATA